MAEPVTDRAFISWTGALAVFSFLAAAWAAIQVGFLASALMDGPPSIGSRLVFKHHDLLFLYSLVFHAVAMVAFGLGGMLAGWLGRQIDQMAAGARRTLRQFSYGGAYLLPALALFVVFQVSNANPMYQIYVEGELEEIIRMETRLMPSGVSEKLVLFGDVKVIRGEMNSSSLWGDRYFLNVVAVDGTTMQVGQGGRNEDPEALYPLARTIAERAGADLELTGSR